MNSRNSSQDPETLLQKNGLKLGEIPEEKRTTALCLAAVTQNWKALQYVPASKQTETLCRVAIDKNWRALEYMQPGAEWTENLCLAAVIQDRQAFQYLPLLLLTETFYLKAVKQDWRALECIPEEKLSEIICLKAIEKDWWALLKIPAERRTETLYLAAIKQDGEALQYVPEAQQTKILCLEAVKEDPRALSFVISDSLKIYCIEQITLEKIITQCYSAQQYFPEKIYDAAIRQLLSPIQHLIVIANEEALDDPEVKDSYLVYANKISTDPNKSRKGKTLLVPKKNLAWALKDLQDNPQLNLVLLGHVLVDVDLLAGLTMATTASWLAQYRNITKVTLLGCNTVKAGILAAEEKLNAATREYEKNKILPNHCGFIFIKKPLTEEIQHKIIADKKLDACYVLLQRTNPEAKEPSSSPLYQLAFLQKNADHSITTTAISLSEKQMLSCRDLLNKGRNFKVPSGQDFQTLHGEQKPLTSDEKRFLLNIYEQTDEKFSKNNPAYAAHKNLYPFLCSVKININEASEMAKLEPSLLSDLVHHIRNNPAITQKLCVKGYRGLIHVDINQGGFHSVPKGVYEKNYIISFFGTKNDSIDRHELARKRNKQVKQILSGTNIPAKAITLKIFI
jgi:hypothetical protein